FTLGYYIWKPFREKNAVKHQQLLLVATLTYIVILYTLLALASPNMGSLARYKIGASPFLIYLLSLPLSFYLYQILPPRVNKPRS
ncbi:MAG: hypothetical protein AAFU64_08630, partial [Bacteroidota bacterium]